MNKHKVSNGLWLNKDGKKICYNPWTHFEVNNPNGDVTMCSDSGTVLGNVNKQTIEEIWNGEKYQMIRKKMYSIGGEKLCNPNCPVLNGMKNYQSLAWYRDIDNQSDCYVNAINNEADIQKGELVLKSKPKWIRFALSYKCNYQCYHCFQKEARIINQKLPETFILDVERLSRFWQFLFIYGGEPTIFPEFESLLKNGEKFPHIKYVMVTNGSRIHKYLDEIKKVNWSYIGISLDAATEKNIKN